MEFDIELQEGASFFESFLLLSSDDLFSMIVADRPDLLNYCLPEGDRHNCTGRSLEIAVRRGSTRARRLLCRRIFLPLEVVDSFCMAAFPPEEIDLLLDSSRRPTRDLLERLSPLFLRADDDRRERIRQMVETLDKKILIHFYEEVSFAIITNSLERLSRTYMVPAPLYVEYAFRHCTEDLIEVLEERGYQA